MTFKDATASCKAWGGYLASWNTAEEQLAVSVVDAASGGPYWSDMVLCSWAFYQTL